MAKNEYKDKVYKMRYKEFSKILDPEKKYEKEINNEEEEESI